MRTNPSGVTEVASLRTDLRKYGEEYERIFGKQHKPCGWCNDTGIYEEKSCPRGCEGNKEDELQNGP